MNFTGNTHLMCYLHKMDKRHLLNIHQYIQKTGTVNMLFSLEFKRICFKFICCIQYNIYEETINDHLLPWKQHNNHYYLHIHQVESCFFFFIRNSKEDRILKKLNFITRYMQVENLLNLTKLNANRLLSIAIKLEQDDNCKM
ncbi:hypothetical protein KUTeg_014667 [Tegillarca granosa]|uniref:Uncharacterized protein n=1 Tax=Tegillarca granosa TaxID=220873 RepID=A0ABQ9EWZ5_TEGGR|nr:hypothetical protein KUTeg_014667 [Tegillarca granosa]